MEEGTVIQEQKGDLLIIGSPYGHPNKRSFTKKFVGLLEEMSEELEYIGSNLSEEDGIHAQITKFEFKPVDSLLLKLLKYIFYQIYAAWKYERTKPCAVIVRPQHLVLLSVYFQFRGVNFAVFAAQAQEVEILQKLSRLTLRVADSIIVESTSTYDWHPPGSEKKFLDGRTYVDLERFSPLPITTSERMTVGYLGLLSERKGILQLIDAIELLNTEHGDEFEFRFGGSGKYEERVHELTYKYNNVSFDGFVPDDELAAFYNKLDVLVLPSASEGLPNVVLESMACGTPALVTAVGEVPQLIEDRANGFLLPNRDPQTISHQLIKIKQRDDLNEIANAAASFIQSNYSREDALVRYDAIVRSLCPDKRRS